MHLRALSFAAFGSHRCHHFSDGVAPRTSAASTRAFLAQALLLGATLLAGCSSSHYVPSDPRYSGAIPNNASLVADTRSPDDPLLFVPSTDGTVYYFANDALLATFPARAGQHIELSAYATGANPATLLRMDDKNIYSSKVRSSVNRIYFSASPLHTAVINP